MLITTTIALISNLILITGQYKDLSVVSVRIETPNQIQILRDAGAKSLACFDHSGDTPMLLDDGTISIVKKLGLHFEVIESNIDRRLKQFEQDRADARSRGIGGWYADYKTWTEVNDKLIEFENDFPEIATHIIIGQTHEGRNIHGIRITAPGDASNRKQVLFNGCQHAREWVAVMVPMYAIENIIDAWYTDDPMQSYLETTEVIIVPIVNPDGYVFTYTPGGDRFWRKNRRNNAGSCEGVDLNRNWSYAWNEGDSTSTNTCSDVYVGPSEFSEPETQAMRNLVYTLPNLVAHIDFHSYSQLILEPWASSNTAPPRANIIKALSSAMSDAIFDVHGETYVAGTGGDLLYLADGVFPDWATDQGALSYTIELRPTGSPGFDLPPSEILPTCEESFEAVRTLIQFINEPITFVFPEGIPTLSTPGELLTFPMETLLVLDEPIYTNTMKLHLRYGNNGPFAQRSVSHNGNNTFTVSIPTSPCGLVSEFWFSVETESGQMVRYPAGDEILTVSTSSLVHMWNMDENPNWNMEGDWAWGIPLGGGGEYGNPDPTSGATGNSVLGYNLAGDYPNNLAEQRLTSTPFSLEGKTNTSLQFQRYLNVEEPAYDHAYIQISIANDAWTTIWENPSTITDSGWQTTIYDISDRADEQSNVRIRWTMGTTDGGWKYSGWNIDDIQIVSIGSSAVQGDVNCDGVVNVTDILAVVSAWGLCNTPCAEDVIPDGVINVSDLLQVIGNW
jgi:hypothetical protein